MTKLGPEFWQSPNFWIPAPRSAPWEVTRLEALALRAGVDANELREFLYDEIERRRREVHAIGDRVVSQ
jgi:hypothetical protein